MPLKLSCVFSWVNLDGGALMCILNLGDSVTWVLLSRPLLLLCKMLNFLCYLSVVTQEDLHLKKAETKEGLLSLPKAFILQTPVSGGLPAEFSLKS